MNREVLIEGYASWLSQFSWNWFATLTFRGYPPTSKANRLFDQWIREVEQNDGGNGFRWVKVAERGANGDNLHFHILVGGLRTGRALPWVSRWNGIAGEAQIESFNPDKNALRYMLKGIDPDEDFDIDIHLPVNHEKWQWPREREI
jgi:hypothetical protein